MKIELGILKNIKAKDIQDDGSIVLPEGLIAIDEYAFSGYKKLISITFPAGLTSIGEYAFYCCRNLASITFPAGLTSIGEYAFYGCVNLTSITFPAGLKSIGEYAFSGCKILTSITLPERLTSMDERAFDGCGIIKRIIINTDNLEKYNTIKALLPEKLQEKVVDFNFLVTIKKIQCQYLQQLINRAEINLLYQQLQRSGDVYPSFFKTVPLEMMVEMNNHMKNSNWYYLKAQQELATLEIPHSTEDQNYHKLCSEIITKYSELAQKRTEKPDNTEKEQELFKLQASSQVKPRNIF